MDDFVMKFPESPGVMGFARKKSIFLIHKFYYFMQNQSIDKPGEHGDEGGNDGGGDNTKGSNQLPGPLFSLQMGENMVGDLESQGIHGKNAMELIEVIEIIPETQFGHRRWHLLKLINYW